MRQEEYIKTLQFIETHLTEPLTLNKLAQFAGYSKYHFSREFKKYAGVSAMEYIVQRKLLKASLEIEKGKKILDVALEYGYSSHSSFSNQFKKKVGFHPSLLKVKGRLKEGLDMRQTKISQKKEELFAVLREHYTQLYREENLIKCFRAAERHYEGKKRYSGEEYITHPLNVAILLSEWEAEEEIILTGLFCDYYRMGELDRKSEAMFPEKMRKLLGGLDTDDWKEMPDDILMIKIAERLHNMRTLQYLEKSRWKEKAKDTVYMLETIRKRTERNTYLEELQRLAEAYLK